MAPLVQEGSDNVGRPSDSDVHEVASGEGAILKRNSADNVGAIGRNLPKEGVSGPVEAVVFHNRFARRDQHRWTPDIAGFEGRITDNSSVACEESNANDLSLKAITGHRPILCATSRAASGCCGREILGGRCHRRTWISDRSLKVAASSSGDEKR